MKYFYFSHTNKFIPQPLSQRIKNLTYIMPCEITPKILVNKIFWSVSILTLASCGAYACDICGCKLGSSFFNLLPNGNGHYVGIRYGRAPFTAHVKNNLGEDEYSSDLYQRFEWVGRWQANKKLGFQVLIPYQVNNMDGNLDEFDVNLKGIGDLTLLASYQLSDNMDDLTSETKYAFSTGFGIKIPIGEYDKGYQDEEVINRNFQMGSGSLDYLITSNLLIGYKSAGISWQNSLKLNTNNKYQYRFGNQFASGLNAFYQYRIKQAGLIPIVGFYHEWAARHTEQEIVQFDTGGKASFLTLGTQFYFRNFVLSIDHQLALSQDYNTQRRNHIEAQGRTNVSILINFAFKSETFEM